MIKMKIGSKLLLSYVLIIVLCFAVGFTVFGVLSRQYMISQARDDLKIQGEALARAIGSSYALEQPGDMQTADTEAGDWPESEIYNAQRKQMQLAGSLVDTRVILINSRGQVAYSNLDSKELEIFKSRRAQNLPLNDFIVEEFPVAGPGGENGGTLVLAASLEDMNRINRMNLRAQMLSVLAALLLALLLGWFFERTISRPLQKLTKAMQGFAVNRPLPDLDVNSGDEVGELAHCFNHLGRELQRYDELQKSLLQNTSHELKTPLMSIQGYAEAIRDGVVEGPEVEDSLNIIIEESQRLKQAVSDLLYLSRLENIEEEHRLEECSLEELISHALRTVRPLADRRGIEIEAEAAPELKARVDPEKMERTLVNILGNAVRYARSCIRIRCQADGDELQISIEDDGPGFQNGEEARVFERFYKGAGGGSGLGLAIAQAIVHGHGGRIQAGNAGAGGAVFRITLRR